MNKDQVKGAAKDLGGKVQEEFGKLTGSNEQQAKGVKNQAAGAARWKAAFVEQAPELHAPAPESVYSRFAVPPRGRGAWPCLATIRKTP